MWCRGMFEGFVVCYFGLRNADFGLKYSINKGNVGLRCARDAQGATAGSGAECNGAPKRREACSSPTARFWERTRDYHFYLITSKSL